MVDSLTKLAHLPDDTLVFCGHEYTQSNLRFARVVDPSNPLLDSWAREAEDLRRRDLPTLPSPLGREKQANPFLRWDDPVVGAAAACAAGQPLDGAVPVFAALREWKNRF
jgi:hydroxyacylglutathione hydrolase